MKEELLKGLSEEQIAKAKKCHNAEEIIKLAKEENVNLSEEQLACISGGGFFCESTPHPTCSCGSTNVKVVKHRSYGTLNENFECTCQACGYSWWM